FTGISIAFIGISELQKSLLISIDNAPQFTQTLGSLPASDPDSYYQSHQWYQTPTLPQGVHTIELTLDSPLDLGLDYMVIVPGPDTSLTGKNVMVDDSFSSIEYIGSWERIAGADFVPPLTGFRMPFQNSTHRTSTVGDILKFSYTGGPKEAKKIAWTGEVAVIFSGGVVLTTSGPQINFPLFTTGKLDAGDHTILVNLTECDSSTLIVDYIAYEPSFSSWSTMPNISLPSLGSQGTTAFPGAATGNTTPVTTSGSKKTPVGAIAGGVVGAWVLLTLLGLFLFWRRK
ncbi:hypothetical protein C8J56DRAFT_754929, partial [Mycena floridula]